MKTLPSELFPPPISALLHSLSSAGFFERSLLIGSWVMPLYQELYEAKYVLRTGDIDFAVHLVHPKKKIRTDLERVLTDLGFIDFFDAEGVQKFSAAGYEVEFIAHRPGGKNVGSLPVREWNISALPLPFINVLFSCSETALLGDFIIRFPVPEAYFVHKLIVAPRRKSPAKQGKDLEQCRVLARILNEERLSEVMKSQRFSKKTKGDIAQSCEAIDFPLQKLELYKL
ncbi:MAG: GSU2403 family nucleotidyltransferase fold protein [Desulfovibrionales bacterium]